jgi:pyruvate ferredoxin oxidoreductase gamma subunit
MAEQRFRRRDQVAHPDFLIVQDAALLHTPGILDGLRPGGGVLVNAPVEPQALGLEVSGPVCTINATRLAVEHLGRPVPNTALLSAFVTLTATLPQEALRGAIEQRFKGRALEANLVLIEAAARLVPAGAWQEQADAHARSA